MRLPDAIIAASPQTAERLREFTGGRVPIVTAPNGIDVEAINAVEAATDPADVVDGRPTAAAQAGRPAARGAGHPARGGTPADRSDRRKRAPARAACTAQAAALACPTPCASSQDIAEQPLLYAALKAARVAVFPSEREGFGIAVLEALACGTPVITTSAPDNLARHLVARSHGGGAVCEPTRGALADAIAAVLDREPQREAEPDQRWLAEYDWASIAASVAATLR